MKLPLKTQRTLAGLWLLVTAVAFVVMVLQGLETSYNGDPSSLAELEKIRNRPEVRKKTDELLRKLVDDNGDVRFDAACDLNLDHLDYSGVVPYDHIPEEEFDPRPGIVETVLVMLRHPNPRIRQDALAYIGRKGRFHELDIYKQVRLLLNDVDPDVRTSAISTIGDLLLTLEESEFKDAIKRLQPFLEDDDEHTRELAKVTIKEFQEFLSIADSESDNPRR